LAAIFTFASDRQLCRICRICSAARLRGDGFGRQAASSGASDSFFGRLIANQQYRPSLARAYTLARALSISKAAAEFGALVCDDWRAGAYSGLILAGAAPAELPVYQSIGIETIVNLKSAKSLGIVLPQAIIDSANALIR
jgi:hypothetical protein